MNWQPIETAPKDGTAILLACVGNGVGEGFCYAASENVGSRDRWYLTRGTAWGPNETVKPTHWMPLPEPPK